MQNLPINTLNKGENIGCNKSVRDNWNLKIHNKARFFTWHRDLKEKVFRKHKFTKKKLKKRQKEKKRK